MDLELVFGLIFRWILVARLIGALVFTAVLWVRKKWAWVILRTEKAHNDGVCRDSDTLVRDFKTRVSLNFKKPITTLFSQWVK